jgi:four helix bundle protein
MFGFQRLDVYRCSAQFLGRASILAARAPRGHAALADQLRRAATSVPLNIAEGTGKGERDAARFYTIARGSALECAAILDVFETFDFVDATDVAQARELLQRVVSMLTKLRQT